MVYTKYKVANDAIGNLDAGISASTTSIVLNAGDGDLFPTTGSAILKLVQYNTPADPTSGVAKSENILMTARTGDTLTVTRGYGGDTPTTFNASDYLYLTNHTDVIEDIQDEVTRLETDKLDSNGELRTGLGNYKVLYTDGSGNETELSLGSANTYMRSTGPSSAPEFGTPPLVINGQTLENGVLEEADEIAFYDASAGANRKRNAKATTSREGLIEIATDSEVVDGTDTERATTPSSIASKYGNTFTPYRLTKSVEYTAAAPLVVGGYGTAQYSNENLYSQGYIGASTASTEIMRTPTTNSQTGIAGNFFVPKGYKFKVEVNASAGSTGSQFYAYPFIS